MSKWLIVVGTESALKLRAVRAACSDLSVDIEIRGTKAKSGVPDQPFGFKQIIEGATNRARDALRQIPSATFAVGIESGLVEVEGRWYDPPCVVALDGSDRKGVRPLVAFGAFFPIPQWVVERVRTENTELGHIVQALSGDGEKDPHNYFSRNRIKREEIIEHAVLCALSSSFCPDRYKM